ncbi:MAG: hypothetical protein ACM3S0_16445 [Acidobacteriota bacterium]
MALLDRVQATYPQVFGALGNFIAKSGLTEVCVMEFEQGIIVTGTEFYETGENYNRSIVTHVLSFDDLDRLIKGAK